MTASPEQREASTYVELRRTLLTPAGAMVSLTSAFLANLDPNMTAFGQVLLITALALIGVTVLGVTFEPRVLPPLRCRQIFGLGVACYVGFLVIYVAYL